MTLQNDCLGTADRIWPASFWPWLKRSSWPILGSKGASQDSRGAVVVCRKASLADVFTVSSESVQRTNDSEFCKQTRIAVHLSYLLVTITRRCWHCISLRITPVRTRRSNTNLTVPIELTR
ncbi:hypothetical protein IG631_24197 [Alternaria alternata]|nr:hypothetical protein IG631_24197 [Alternaria alternata]